MYGKVHISISIYINSNYGLFRSYQSNDVISITFIESLSYELVLNGRKQSRYSQRQVSPILRLIAITDKL